MNHQIIGISGSPIKNSNTDRLIQAVLDAHPEVHDLGVCRIRGRYPRQHRRHERTSGQSDDESSLHGSLPLASGST